MDLVLPPFCTLCVILGPPNHRLPNSCIWQWLFKEQAFHMQTEQWPIPFHSPLIRLSHPGPLSPDLITLGQHQTAEANPKTPEPISKLLNFLIPNLTGLPTLPCPFLPRKTMIKAFLKFPTLSSLWLILVFSCMVLHGETWPSSLHNCESLIAIIFWFAGFTMLE